MENKIKNTILAMMLTQIGDKFDVKNEINVFSGGRVSAYEYFEVITELTSLGHINDPFLPAAGNFESDSVRTIYFIPKKSLKLFLEAGGFV